MSNIRGTMPASAFPSTGPPSQFPTHGSFNYCTVSAQSAAGDWALLPSRLWIIELQKHIFPPAYSDQSWNPVLEVGCYKSRWTYGVLGARYLLGINTCEGRRRKQGWAEGEVEVWWKPDWSLGQLGVVLVPAWPSVHPELAKITGPFYPHLVYMLHADCPGKDMTLAKGFSPAEANTEELTAGGGLLITLHAPRWPLSRLLKRKARLSKMDWTELPRVRKLGSGRSGIL